MEPNAADFAAGFGFAVALWLADKTVNMVRRLVRDDFGRIHRYTTDDDVAAAYSDGYQAGFDTACDWVQQKEDEGRLWTDADDTLPCGHDWKATAPEHGPQCYLPLDHLEGE